MLKFFLKRGQILRFMIAGGAAATVDLSLLYLFTDIIGLWYLFSACLAFTAAFFVSFFLQKFWTFKDNGRQGMYRQLRAYLAVTLTNFFLNALLLYALVDGFKIWYLFAQVLAGGLIAVESFLIYQILIFDKCRQGDKIRILIATGIYPPDIGGPATMLKAMADALTERGLEVRTITYADRGGENGGVYRISRRSGKFWRYLNYFWRLLLLSRQTDLLYVTDTYSVGYFAYLIKKLTGKKYLIRFAGDSAWEIALSAGWTDDYITDFQKNKQNLKLEKLKLRRQKIMQAADAVIAVSNFMAGLAEAIGVKKEKITVIYNAVDFFPPPPPRRAPAKPVLVYAGRLVKWKGVATIIRAVAEVKKNWPEIILEILGDGPEEVNLKKITAELGLSENVVFRGRVSEEASHEYFSRATIFVLNTFYEGLPHSVLNAMRAGLPVIATPAGGNPEVVTDGDNGLLAPHNELEDWIKAIDKLLNDRELGEKFSRNGLETVKRFKWSEAVEKTAALICDLCLKFY